MGSSRNSREHARLKRKARVRKRVRGTEEKPRLCIYRSHRYTYAQLISDDGGRVLASASTREATGGGVEAEEGAAISTRSVASAKALGLRIAELAKERNIEAVTFDRNGYLYHGRVKAVADGAREGGLAL